MKLMVDEEDGKEDGGSNSFGSYFSFSFDGEEIFPDGLCEMPTNSIGEEPRCDPLTNETLSFLMGKADALSIVSCTPPPMRYFSYDVSLIPVWRKSIR